MAKYDLLIRGGLVLLPGQEKETQLSVAVRGGKIAALTTEEADAELEIDAGGLYVSPGFIDSHMHDDDITDDGSTVEQALLRQGVIVRPIAAYGMPHWLRVSIGLPEENARFIEALRQALA